MSLTATRVKNLKAKEKTYLEPAGESLYLQVTTKGTKSWIFRYRIENKPFKKSFGKYPDVTLEDARQKRDEARRKLANDLNPFPPKIKEEDLNIEKTYKEWSEFYMDKVSGDVSETHLVRTLKGFKADVYPYIGDMQMNDIKAKHIINILHVMKDRGAVESAKKVFSSISRCFQVCIANFPDEIDRNPTKDITMKDILGKRKEVHYPIITDDKELGILLKSFDTYTGHISTKLALKLISSVFVRPHNIRHAEWSEINFDTKQWVIPPKKMKTKRELIVPLSKQVIKILKEAKKISADSELVFPSPKGKNTPLSDAALVGALRRIGYTKTEIVAHSFRGIFSTIAHEKGIYSHDIIETQLAHSVGSSVSQAYNRAVYLKERTELMQWYSDHLEYIQSDAVQEDD